MRDITLRIWQFISALLLGLLIWIVASTPRRHDVHRIEIDNAKGEARSNKVDHLDHGVIEGVGVEPVGSDSEYGIEFERLLALPDGEQKRVALVKFIRQIAVADLELAVCLASKVSEKYSDDVFKTLFESALQDKDVSERFRFVVTTKSGSERAKYLALQSILENAKSSDLESVSQLLSGLDMSVSKKVHLGSFLISKCIGENPEEVMSWCYGVGNPEVSDGLLTFAASRDPNAALDYSSKMDGGSRRDHLIKVAVSYVNSLDLDQAKRLALDAGRTNPDLLQTIAANLSRTSIEDARAFAEAMPYGKLRDQACLTLAEEWSKTDDVDSALDWAKNLEKDSARSLALLTIYGNMARNDPRATADSLSQDHGLNRDERASIYRAVAHEWALRDRDGAFAWLLDVPEDLVPYARGAIYGSFAMTDEQGYVGFVKGQFDEVDPRRKDFRNLMPVLKPALDRSPMLAAELLNEYRSSFHLPEMEKALVGVARKWVSLDSLEASAWIGALPASTARDRAISDLVRRLSVPDPESARQWATEIQDVELRSRLLKNLNSRQ